ncbi:MAG: AAA family ATPase [Spirochaetaceae bacterium]|nr:AAA family ATPase [Spirochaetaceae bacterium]
MLDLCAKYRPVHLKDLYGQVDVRAYFQSVVKKIDDAPHYFLISGAFGTGKSSLARAFAMDLAGSLDFPVYTEIDSAEKSLQSDFDRLRDVIFQEIGSYKVVVFDECHLLGKVVESQLLKVVEDYYGALVLLFCTTNPEMMTDTLRSRLHQFTLSTFTSEQCKEYAQGILGAEGLEVSERALDIAAINAQGHLRNMVKQVEQIVFMGEQVYLDSYSSVLKGIEEFFVDFGKDDKASVEALCRYHPAELRSLVMYFLRENIINPAGRNSQKYPRNVIPGLFANYLRLSGLVKEPDDYFSVLLVFRQQLRGVVRGGDAKK